MIADNIAFIANYFWKTSIDNINSILSDGQVSNFNMNDYYYLTVIYQLGNPNLGDVAKELKLTKPSISAMVQRLIKNDLIEKVQSEEDKRVFHLSLTEKGCKIVQGDYALYRNLTNELTKALTEEQVSEADCLLSMFVDKIKENQDKKRDT